VQIVAVGVAVQVAIIVAQPVSDGVAVHCANVRLAVPPVPPVLPMQIGSVGLVGQVAMICAHSGMVGVDWQTA